MKSNQLSSSNLDAQTGEIQNHKFIKLLISYCHQNEFPNHVDEMYSVFIDFIRVYLHHCFNSNIIYIIAVVLVRFLSLSVLLVSLMLLLSLLSLFYSIINNIIITIIAVVWCHFYHFYYVINIFTKNTIIFAIISISIMIITIISTSWKAPLKNNITLCPIVQHSRKMN